MSPAFVRPLILISAACAVLALPGCAPTARTIFSPTPTSSTPFSGELTPRPHNAPDVLLLAVSGRCPPNCLAPDDNIDYLTPRGTVQAVVSALEAQGLSVVSYAVAAHLGQHTPRTISQAQVGAGRSVAASQDGFLQLEARLNTAYTDWIRERSNPTRIVLLAHSHGVVWTHALVRAHPEVPIATMIDLDGVCDFWETDNRRQVRAYVSQLGRNPWGFNLSDPCGSVRVGNVRYDLKDVVYPNVAVNLEVQSQRLVGREGGSVITNFPFDGLQNVRSDGSRTGLLMFRSAGETHSSVSKPGSRAFAWVSAQLGSLSASWKGQPVNAAPPVSVTCTSAGGSATLNAAPNRPPAC